MKDRMKKFFPPLFLPLLLAALAFFAAPAPAKAALLLENTLNHKIQVAVVYYDVEEEA
ncbi:hypothetical protein LJC36_01725 [Desulfovibrio sp. OttesenSCG-928-C14]|nr:hypothetical protein [Desulfovibrio sp. OttesenSCG-928-C14]